MFHPDRFYDKQWPLYVNSVGFFYGLAQMTSLQIKNAFFKPSYSYTEQPLVFVTVTHVAVLLHLLCRGRHCSILDSAVEAETQLLFSLPPHLSFKALTFTSFHPRRSLIECTEQHSHV